jgi:pyruvate formate lyase activating enzyme
MSRDAILGEIKRYRRALTVARGGVTFSGGEPLLQDRLTMAVVDGCRELGLHTALDTSGRLGDRLSDAELGRIDLQLLDMKAGDEETCERVTRQPLAPTVAYARRLAALGRPTWVRFVLVPGLTDGEAHIERLADLVAALGSIVERVEVLRFHQMGRYKWEALELDYTLADTEPPDAALVERVRGQFRARGLNVY